MATESTEEHGKIKVIKDFSDLPCVLLSKHHSTSPLFSLRRGFSPVMGGTKVPPPNKFMLKCNTNQFCSGYSNLLGNPCALLCQFIWKLERNSSPSSIPPSRSAITGSPAAKGACYWNGQAQSLVIMKFTLYTMLYMYDLEVNYHESSQLHRP